MAELRHTEKINRYYEEVAGMRDRKAAGGSGNKTVFKTKRVGRFEVVVSQTQTMGAKPKSPGGSKGAKASKKTSRSACRDCHMQACICGGPDISEKPTAKRSNTCRSCGKSRGKDCQCYTGSNHGVTAKLDFSTKIRLRNENVSPGKIIREVSQATTKAGFTLHQGLAAYRAFCTAAYNSSLSPQQFLAAVDDLAERIREALGRQNVA
jgi:hypothetical protein